MNVLALHPAPKVKNTPPPIPKGVLAEVGATKALWRAKAACGDLVIWAERKPKRRSKSASAPEPRVLIVCRVADLRASFDMPEPRGDAAWREALHARGDRFYYANDHQIWQLVVADTVT